RLRGFAVPVRGGERLGPRSPGGVRPVRRRRRGRLPTAVGPVCPPTARSASMSLSRTDAGVGAGAPAVPVEQPAVRRVGLCVAGGHAEPAVPGELLLRAVPPEAVEGFRPLLPVGYAAGADAYRATVAGLTADDLTNHYTTGLDWFRGEFVPHLK